MPASSSSRRDPTGEKPDGKAGYKIDGKGNKKFVPPPLVKTERDRNNMKGTEWDDASNSAAKKGSKAQKPVAEKPNAK